MTIFKTKLIQIILLLQLIFCLQFCSYTNKDIQNKWSGYGGTLIFDIQPNHKLNILSIDDSSTFSEWKLIGENLIFSDISKLSHDTLIILHLSQDSLVLDLANPRGYLIKTFYRYILPKKRYKKDEIKTFLIDKKFDIKDVEGANIQTVSFDKNGQYSTNGEVYTWELKTIEGYVYMVLTGMLSTKSFSKVVNFTKNELELEVYNSNEDFSYNIKMKLLE